MTRIATPAAALSSRSPLGTTGTVQHDARPDQRLFRWTLIFSALMSYVPDELHWSNVAFTTTFALLFAWNLLTPPAGLLRVPTTKYLLCFFLAVGISFPNAVLQGVQASEWLRGAIPFFFLVAHLFVGPQDGGWVAQCVVDV